MKLPVRSAAPPALSDAKRAEVPADAGRRVDALLARAEIATLVPRPAAADPFDAAATLATGAPSRPAARDNGIAASLGHGPVPGPAKVGWEATLDTVGADVASLSDTIRAGLAGTGVPMSLGRRGTAAPGADRLGARLAELAGGDSDLGPGREIPGFGTAPALLDARTAGEFSRGRTSAEGEKKGESSGESSASGALIEALEDAAAKVPVQVKEFLSGAASAILPWVAGVAATVGLGNRDEAALRDTANGIRAGRNLGSEDGGLMGSQAGREMFQRRQQLTHPDLGPDAPSTGSAERDVARRGGLVNPIREDRTLDAAAVAAKTLVAIQSKVNPSPAGGTDGPSGPLVAPDSGVADPPAAPAPRGGKVTVPGGPPPGRGPVGQP